MLKMTELISQAKSIITGKPPKNAEKQQSEKELLEDIDCVINELAHCRRRFNLVTDNDLIEAVIYEELALRSRYAYLLRQARRSGLTGRTVLK